MFNNIELKDIELANTKIWTADQLDGYGLLTVSDFISVVKHCYGNHKFANVMEWCSGPGYFGFMMHKYNIAESVTLVDMFEPLEQVVNTTIKENNLEKNIKFILSNNFHNVNEKFDLIVGNPPHFNMDLAHTPATDHYHEHRKFVDLDWQIHEDFFNNVKDHLTEDGKIFLMENAKGSDRFTFKDMIEKNDLKINRVFASQSFPKDTWYMEIVKQH